MRWLSLQQHVLVLLGTAVMLTAGLTEEVIGLKGDEAPTAASISARYRSVDEE